MPSDVRLFRCRSDNFGVLLHDRQSGATASVDAPEAEAIETALAETGWRLTDILVTHHHGDHTAGIAALKARYRCRVVAPAAERAKIPEVDVAVREGDTVEVGRLKASVIETPGHTLGHIAYWFAEENLAFVGDTLFSVGCGRVLETGPEPMWQSLLKLRALPDATQIYCGHEYTASNIRFALSIDPANAALKAREEEVARLAAAGQPTIPATIGEEKRVNPFLRADDAGFRQALGMTDVPAAEVFGEIRARKDRF